MKDFAIIANGSFLVREIIAEAIHNKIILALDGGAEKLIGLGIKPHIILGDFDSLTDKGEQYFGIKKSADLPYQGAHGITIVPAKNQAQTDLTKGIRYCDSLGATSITILCALGGRLDHQESVLRSLRTEYKKERPLLLHSEQQTIRFAKDETIFLNGEVGDKCGIVAYPQGVVSSQGLEYESDNFPLKFGFSESTCNALQVCEATVTIQGEALIIMPPMLSSQRQFMRLSRVEQLEMLLRDAKGVIKG